MKLTNDQIESIRAVSPELAEKLEAGEKVTVEKAVEKWEPDGGMFSVLSDGSIIRMVSTGNTRLYGTERQAREAAKRLANDQRIFNRLHAYRDEFAPGYVVPPAGYDAWAPRLGEDGIYRPFRMGGRLIGAIYFPEDICDALCRKLNSGEVVL